MSTSSIPAWLKQQVRRREKLCYRCNQPIDWSIPFFVPGTEKREVNKEAGTVEHLIPRAVRPDLAHDPANCVASHQGCNSQAGARGTVYDLGKPSRSW